MHLNLETATSNLLSSDSTSQNLVDAQRDFIEVLARSTAEEIYVMLKTQFDEDYLGLPFWARLISFRILCLLKPENIEYKKMAEGDISALGGSSWDNIVDW